MRKLTVVAALAACLGIAGILYGSDGRTPSAAPLPTSPRSSSGGGLSSVQSRLPGPLPGPATGTTIATPTPQIGLRATSIRIPALRVTAAIGVAAVTDGVLTPPREPDVVGAWSGSAALDAPSGEVTLAGHVNWAGMAPFAFGRLAYLRPGDLVYTTDRHATQTAWRVVSVAARPKTASVDPAAFAGPDGPRKLVLITCGGAFDSSQRSYDDNVYVSAVPAA